MPLGVQALIPMYLRKAEPIQGSKSAIASIWRAANLMLKRYGDRALEESAARADELAAQDDYNGAAVWRRITRGRSGRLLAEAILHIQMRLDQVVNARGELHLGQVTAAGQDDETSVRQQAVWHSSLPV
jgi:hypothetical protein